LLAYMPWLQNCEHNADCDGTANSLEFDPHEAHAFKYVTEIRKNDNFINVNGFFTNNDSVFCVFCEIV
jgi:hypothetical protein